MKERSPRLRPPARRLAAAAVVAILGAASPLGSAVHAASVNAFDYPCHSGGGATGDFNNDGFPDLAVGVPGDDLEQAVAAGSATRGWPDAGSINVVYANPDATGLDPQYAVTGSGPSDTRTPKYFSQNTPGVGDAAEASDNFGYALAAGNFDGAGGDDLAVGVPGEDGGTGAVQILYSGPPNGRSVNSLANTEGIVVGTPGTPTSNAIITQDTPGVNGTSETGDHFGYALAAGDLNGDAFSDLVIGIPHEDIGSAPDAGMIQILYGTPHGLDPNGAVAGGVLADQSFQQGPGPVARPEVGRAEPGDMFGAALAVGQFNGALPQDLAVGSPAEDVRHVPDGGAVRVLYSLGVSGLSTTDAGFFSQQTLHVDGIAETADRMGCSLSAGDFDGDGDDDLAVGAPGEGVGRDANAGIVHVLSNTGASIGLSVTPDLARTVTTFWREDRIWAEDDAGIPGGSSPDDRMGAALASGDFNKDGADDLAIGVPTDRLYTGRRSGSVRVLYGVRSIGLSDGSGTGGGPHPSIALAQSPSEFESTCLLYGLVEEPSLLAPLADALGGACLVPNALLGSNDYSPLLMVEEQGDLFGASLAAADFDRDGSTDLSIGSPGEDVGLFADWLAEDELAIPDELLLGIFPIDESANAGMLNVVYAPLPSIADPDATPPAPDKQDVIYREGGASGSVLRSAVHTVDDQVSLGVFQDDRIRPSADDPSRSNVLDGDGLGGAQS
jgi:hypothetical protein